MTPSNDDHLSWIPDEPSALAAWDQACCHADEALHLDELAEVYLASDKQSEIQAGLMLKKAANHHRLFAAAYLAVGGFGKDRTAHLTVQAPFTSIEPTDGWDLDD